MLFMVRSLGRTLNLLQWSSFAFLILLSVFAIYCVEANTLSNDLTLYQQRRNSLADPKKQTAAADLLPTELVLVATMDGSIRGVDRFQGIVHWTLKGGPKSSMIKSSSDFKIHKWYKPGPTSETSDDDSTRLFMDDVLGDENLYQDSDYHLAESPYEENGQVEDADVYYIIEPHDGGTLYLYADGRPLEVTSFLFFTKIIIAHCILF